jgi:hypothetical protein
MYYHAILYFENAWNWWANRSSEDILAVVIIPFINKQIVTTNSDETGNSSLLNTGMAIYLRTFVTDHELPIDTEKEKNTIKERIESEGTDCTNKIIEMAMAARIFTPIGSLLQKQFTPTIKQVFVIMQFKDKILDSAYQCVIKPVIKQHGYQSLRIDEVQDSGRINEQILQEISKSEIVYADLSGERPNCYYEAGFAHAIGKKMIFTVRSGTPIHFDLSAYRFITWDTENELKNNLSSDLNRLLHFQITKDNIPSNPIVSSTLPFSS